MKVAYYIITADFSAAFDENDNQLTLEGVKTLEECLNLATQGIEIYL